MQVVNWLRVVPQEAEIDILRQILNPIADRKMRQVLVEAILRSLPWEGRSDLIPIYTPKNGTPVPGNMLNTTNHAHVS